MPTIAKRKTTHATLNTASPEPVHVAAAPERTHDREEVDWSAALCAQTDPEAFFPQKGGSTHEAKAICAECELQNPCLEWALRTDQRFGIWGGKSERERRHLRRGRRTNESPGATR